MGVVLVISVVSFAGYKVSNTIAKSKTVSTTKPSLEIEQTKVEPKQEQVVPVSVNPPVSKDKAPQPTPPSPAPVQKSTSTFTTSITIKGDATCQSQTLEALKLLSTNTPKHYSTITSYISVIECVAQGSGMLAYENPPRYLVGDATRNAGTVWLAGTIAHDAGHSRLYHDYLSAHPGESVPNEIWTGEAAERTCLEAQHDALTKIGGTQTQLDHVMNIINSQYYNVPYDQRWW